jgi:hypothetical protein
VRLKADLKAVENTNLLLLPKIEPQFLDFSGRRLVTITTDLSRLSRYNMNCSRGQNNTQNEMVLLNVVTSDHPRLGFFNYSVKL